MPVSPSLFNRPGRVGVGNTPEKRPEDARRAAAEAPQEKKVDALHRAGREVSQLGKSGSEAVLSMAHFTHEQLRGRAGHVSPVGRRALGQRTDGMTRKEGAWDNELAGTPSRHPARMLIQHHDLPNPWNRKTQKRHCLSVADEKSEEAEDLLHNDTHCCHVMDPENTHWRMRWNIFVLILIIYVIIVVPFEIAFLVETSGLTAVNYVVDVFFFVDICLEFNTAYFDEERQRWILDRKKIARHYCQCWFWVDVASVFPFALFLGDDTKWVRMMRAFKALKLLRVCRSFRMLAHMAKHVAVSTKGLVLTRYVILLLFCIHWAACGLRLSHAANPEKTTVLSEDRMGNLGGENTGRRIWGEYILCCLWAFATMNGEYNVYTDYEYVLSLALMLIGCFALAFLVGELTNTVSNLDPVANDFRLRLDNLNDYMAKSNFPDELRTKLREYIMESESIFEDNYYKEVIEQLSPSLQAHVANQNFGDVVSRIPFVAYTVQAVCGVKVGTVVSLHGPQWTPDLGLTIGDGLRHHKHRRKPAQTRHARVVSIPRYLSYDVIYLDNGEREDEVDNARVCRVFSDARGGRMDRHFLLHYEYAEFTVEIAKLLHSTLHLGKDTIIHRYLSMNDALYVISKGQVRLFGRKSHLLYDVETRHASDFFGDDISMVVATGEEFKPLLRHYTARAVRVTQLLKLDAAALHTILQKPCFERFSHHIHNYGRWMRLKVAMIMSIRKRLTDVEHLAKPPRIVTEVPLDAEDDASAFDSGSDDGGQKRQAAYVVEQLAGVLARPTPLSVDVAAKLDALAAALAGAPPPPPSTTPFAPSTMRPAAALGATPPLARPRRSDSTSLDDE